jgi:H+/Cl- antiporter ClcA
MNRIDLLLNYLFLFGCGVFLAIILSWGNITIENELKTYKEFDEQQKNIYCNSSDNWAFVFTSIFLLLFSFITFWKKEDEKKEIEEEIRGLKTERELLINDYPRLKKYVEQIKNFKKKKKNKNKK